MKKLNIDYCFITEFGDIFRPSMRSSVSSLLFRKNLGRIKQVCMMEESEFRLLPFATDEVVKRIKERMETHGLRFGMTEEELNFYQDEEYLLLHPEEKDSASEDAQPDEPEQPNEVEEPDEHEEPAKQEQPDELADVMEKLALYANRLRDEFTGVLIGHHVLAAIMEVYIHQPWWVKMFCGRKERHIRACEETLFVCDTFLKLTDEQSATDEQLSTDHPEE